MVKKARRKPTRKPTKPAPATPAPATPAAEVAVMPAAIASTVTTDTSGNMNMKLAIGLVVVAVVVLIAFLVWYFVLRDKGATSSAAGRIANGTVAPTINPACIRAGAYPVGFPSPAGPEIPSAGTNICTDVLMTQKTASIDQKKPFYIHNDCANDPDTAGPGVISGVVKPVKFIYDPVTKTYQVRTTGCTANATTYALCAFENGGQKAKWLNLKTQSVNSPALSLRTTEKDLTGARSCNWNLVNGTSGGWALQVPETADTESIRKWYFGTALTVPGAGYWKSDGGAGPIYYAPAGIVKTNTSESTFILSPYEAPK